MDCWLPGAGGRGQYEVTAHGYKVSCWAAENVLNLDSGVSCTIY